MGEPFVGEIRMFGGSFAPAGWAFCDGAFLPISENETLFNLIGTTYGGDGQETFALPDLQGRVPIHMGQGPGLSSYQIGERGGVESVTLTTQQIPTHNHAVAASNQIGLDGQPTNGFYAQVSTGTLYHEPGDPLAPMNAQLLQPTGGSQPHENIQPYLAISFILSLFGVFPSQT